MRDLLAAVGLVLAVEGTFYALAPQAVRAMMRRMVETPADTLRIGGLVAVAAGVGIVWLVRGG